MSDREKLIEIIMTSEILCDDCGENTASYCAEALADHLIANGVTFAPDISVGDKLAPTDNGVTVQQPDGCEYCNDPHPARDCVLPDGLERILVVYDDGSFLGKPFVNHREIKFCPMCGRRVSQTPKGE